MNKTYSLGRFEFFVVAIAVGVVVSVGLNRYLKVADDARDLSFEMVANHFSQSASNLRANWLIYRQKTIGDAGLDKSGMPVGSRLFYFAEQGWPVGISSGVAATLVPTVEDCLALWQVLLQNPPALTTDPEQLGQAKYHTVVVHQGCRYLRQENGKVFDYFDYSLADGQVNFIRVD